MFRLGITGAVLYMRQQGIVRTTHHHSYLHRVTHYRKSYSVFKENYFDRICEDSVLIPILGGMLFLAFFTTERLSFNCLDVKIPALCIPLDTPLLINDSCFYGKDIPLE